VYNKPNPRALGYIKCKSEKGANTKQRYFVVTLIAITLIRNYT